MSLMRWGKLLLVTGLLIVVGSILPALLLAVLPPSFGDGFFALVAFLLTLSLTPLGGFTALLGLILALVALLRGDGWRPRARAPSPPGRQGR